ncbi:MAG: amidohydrolase family protein, partial [Clostridia bacterium]|nr:amidohydrolase family protein [Clostridia bacterium]
LAEAVKMITEVPARIMGLSSKGRIAKGMDADICVFDDDVNVKAVFAKGNMIEI